MRNFCFSSLVAAVIVATPALGAEPLGVINSAHSLALACRSVERPASGQNAKTVSADAVLCVGYMQAMQDLSVLSNENQQRLLGSCPAATTTLHQLIQAFVDYSRTHPDRGDENAAVTVIRSFQVAYPCPAIGETARASEPSLYPTSRK